MQFKNIEIYNTKELIHLEDGAVSWIRVPQSVYEKIESDRGKRQLMQATGVELRFVMNSPEVKIKMKSLSTNGMVSNFHVYFGSIQGGWDGHEVNKYVNTKYTEFTITKPDNMPVLKRISEEFHHPFDPEVVRIIFERGQYAILDIEGDVSVPKTSQLPKETLLCYGSSITHGSNALSASNTWPSLLSHHLKMDLVNLGMAGSCQLEPCMIDYISEAKWDKAILELGINVLNWEEDLIRKRVSYTIDTIASKNPNKQIYIISPFYCFDDYFQEGRAQIWRNIIQEIIEEKQYPNITYINGLDLLGNMSYISQDMVHPNIYGIQGIFEKLYKILK